MKQKNRIDLKSYSTAQLQDMHTQVDQLLSIHETKKRAFNEFLVEAKTRGYDLPALVALMQAEGLR